MTQKVIEVKKILYELARYKWELRDNKYTVDDVITNYAEKIVQICDKKGA